MKQLALVFLIGFGAAQAANAFNPYPPSAGEAYRKLPNVKKGGTIYGRQISNPKTLNPLTTNDTEYMNVLPFIFARLLEYDYDSNSYFPMLAEKLDVSKDHKVMTYTLRKEARWEDGTPVTTDDVEYTFNKLMDVKVEAAEKRVYFEDYKFEKVDQLTFRFTVTKPNVNTLDETNYDFLVLQKKQYDGVEDFNKAKALISPIGNGPYRVKLFSRDQKLELERKKDWWGYQVPEMKNLYNFDNIVYRIIPDTSLAYEKFIKGEIDVLEMNAEMFGTRVKGSDKERFGSSENSGKEIWANHFKTQGPVAYTYLGWNLDRPYFKSKKTRQAMGMLIDYEQIIEKVFHNEATRCWSPFGSNTPNTAPEQKNKMFKFDPKKAVQLLKEDGWADSDGNNTLTKTIDGKKTKFEFTLIYNSENPMRAKIAQMVKEQFSKAGITVNVQAIEFNTLLSRVDNRDYDACILSWGKGNLNANTTQLWATKSYLNKGSNMGHYSNPEADQLMEKTEQELDAKKTFQKLFKNLAL